MSAMAGPVPAPPTLTLQAQKQVSLSLPFPTLNSSLEWTGEDTFHNTESRLILKKN